MFEDESTAIKIPKETEKKLLGSIKLTKIGPTVYNRGASEAQEYLKEGVADLDDCVYEPDIDY